MRKLKKKNNKNITIFQVCHDSNPSIPESRQELLDPQS